MGLIFVTFLSADYMMPLSESIIAGTDKLLSEPNNHFGLKS